jgi:hypothetical protein
MRNICVIVGATRVNINASLKSRKKLPSQDGQMLLLTGAMIQRKQRCNDAAKTKISRWTFPNFSKISAEFIEFKLPRELQVERLR